MDAVKEYGVTEKTWQCPTLARAIGSDLQDSASDVPKIHYTPAKFDESPLTPRKWAGMPWLMELSDIHHGGAIMIRTDGAVQSVDDAVLDANGG